VPIVPGVPWAVPKQRLTASFGNCKVRAAKLASHLASCFSAPAPSFLRCLNTTGSIASVLLGAARKAVIDCFDRGVLQRRKKKRVAIMS
jgi:hypothetical protein